MHALKVLEFDEIRSRLAVHCESELARGVAEKCVPSFDASEVWELLFQTQEAHEALGHLSMPSLSPIISLKQELRRAGKGAVLGSKELYDIAAAANAMILAADTLASSREKYPRLWSLASGMPVLTTLSKEIFDSTDGIDLLDSASPELQSLRKRKNSLSSKVLDVIQTVLNRNRDLLSDLVYTVRDGRYVLPLKAENRGKIKGIVHDTSASGQTIYVEPESVLAIGNEIKEVEALERHEVLRILTKLSSKVGVHANELLTGLELAASIDLIFARARFAYEIKGSAPVPLATTGIEVENAKHPLMDPTKAVPLNLAVAPGSSVIVTGPNTGGKTVSIKTIGLFVCMAQCGMFPPALHWKFCPFSRLWADIGDEQSLNQSLSTFSAHIKNIGEALRNVEKNSLVLLDELGAGTDPAEGSALAREILAELHDQGAAVLASTHYGELKAFAFETEGFQNAAMEFDNKTFQPTYKLIMGAPGASHALKIAEKYGIPKNIVDRARAGLDHQDRSLASMMESLEVSQKLARQAQAEADRRSAELKQKDERATRKLIEADEIRKSVREKSHEAIEEVLRQLRLEAEDLFEELKRAPSDARVQSHVRQGLRDIQSRGSKIRDQYKAVEKAPTQSVSLEAGMAIKVDGYGQPGVVLETPKGKQVKVQMGVLKMTVPVHKVIPIQAATKPPSRQTQTMLQAAQTVKSEIHLRALRAEDAQLELEKFIDDAVMAGIEKVRIVHGKGEGILREMTHQYLKLRSDVKDFHDADSAEGGFGVTVVHF